MQVGDILTELERAPVVPWQMVVGDGALVVLAPHPDDETLGCGGVISAAVEAGRPVEIVVLTDGSASHPGSRAFPPDRLAAIRRDEARQAAATLGVSPDHVTFLGLPDAAAPRSGGPGYDEAVEAVAALCKRVAATALLVSWEHDPHCDHEAAAEVACAVGRRCPEVRLWRYPIWGLHRMPGETVDQRPFRSLRVDVTRWLARKTRALDCHASQLGRVVHDDPTGFQLSPEMMARFLDGFERFIGDPT